MGDVPDVVFACDICAGELDLCYPNCYVLTVTQAEFFFNIYGQNRTCRLSCLCGR